MRHYTQHGSEGSAAPQSLPGCRVLAEPHICQLQQHSTRCLAGLVNSVSSDLSQRSPQGLERPKLGLFKRGHTPKVHRSASLQNCRSRPETHSHAQSRFRSLLQRSAAFTAFFRTTCVCLLSLKLVSDEALSPLKLCTGHQLQFETWMQANPRALHVSHTSQIKNSSGAHFTFSFLG